MTCIRLMFPTPLFEGHLLLLDSGRADLASPLLTSNDASFPLRFTGADRPFPAAWTPLASHRLVMRATPLVERQQALFAPQGTGLPLPLLPVKNYRCYLA